MTERQLYERERERETWRCEMNGETGSIRREGQGGSRILILEEGKLRNSRKENSEWPNWSLEEQIQRQNIDEGNTLYILNYIIRIILLRNTVTTTY